MEGIMEEWKDERKEEGGKGNRERLEYWNDERMGKWKKVAYLWHLVFDFPETKGRISVLNSGPSPAFAGVYRRDDDPPPAAP